MNVLKWFLVVFPVGLARSRSLCHSEGLLRSALGSVPSWSPLLQTCETLPLLKSLSREGISEVRQWVEISYCGQIYTMEINKCYRLGFFSPLGSQLLNVDVDVHMPRSFTLLQASWIGNDKSSIFLESREESHRWDDAGLIRWAVSTCGTLHLPFPLLGMMADSCGATQIFTTDPGTPSLLIRQCSTSDSLKGSCLFFELFVPSPTGSPPAVFMLRTPVCCCAATIDAQ